MILIKLFLTFFKIGLFTFGGGYAMLPLIQSEVLGNNWLTDTELIDFIAISESTPGPFAVNISTYVGTVLNSFLGGFFATLGVVLPSFIIILIVAKCFDKFKKNKIVSGCMSGLKPCVIGLIGSAVISMAKTVFLTENTLYINTSFIASSVIFLITGFLAFKKTHPILIIIVSALLGIIFGVFFVN